MIQSELAGLAYDSLQQVFRKPDIRMAMEQTPLELQEHPTIFTVIDPAAGGPQSDYAVVSIVRHRGNITVIKQFATTLAPESQNELTEYSPYKKIPALLHFLGLERIVSALRVSVHVQTA